MKELEIQIQKAMIETPVKFTDTDLYLLCAYYQIGKMSEDLKSLANGRDDMASIILPDISKDGSYSRDSSGKILGVEFRAIKDPTYDIAVDFRVGILKMDITNKIFLAAEGRSNWYPTDPNEILKLHQICTKLVKQVTSDESQKIRFNMVLLQKEKLIEHFSIGTD